MVLNEISASAQIGFPILSAMIFFPVLAALALRFIGDETLARRAALAAAGFELLLTVMLLVGFIPGTAAFQYSERHLWIETIGASYHLGVDGISVLFMPLTALITLMVMLLGGNGTRFMSKAYLSNILCCRA